MRMKYALLALASLGLVLQPGSSWAAPNRAMDVRWEGTLDAQASRLVVRNLSARPTRAVLGSRAVSIPAEGVAEIPVAGLGADPLRLRSAADLLVLQVQDGFDARSLDVEKIASGRPEQARGKLLPRPLRPDWTEKLVAGVPHVRHGAAGTVTVSSDDPAAQLEVAVELLTPHTAVRIRQLDTWGNEVASVVASASTPVRWRATLGPVNGESRIELKTLLGEAKATAAAVAEGESSGTERSPLTPVTKAGGGIGKFEPSINWNRSPDLYYRVTGGPPNLCGDVYVSRNGGPYIPTAGWMCLDSNGNGLKGPWTWANQNGTELAFAYMVWSNGLSTNTDQHIWDKTAPTATIDSPFASPAPTSFYGRGNDVGAGFSASWGSSCSNYFYNRTTDSYWDPFSNRYFNAQFPVHVACTISGMPSTSVSWNQSQIPPGFAHVSGHCYEWAVFLYESNESDYYGFAKINFCVP